MREQVAALESAGELYLCVNSEQGASHWSAPDRTQSNKDCPLTHLLLPSLLLLFLKCWGWSPSAQPSFHPVTDGWELLSVKQNLCASEGFPGHAVRRGDVRAAGIPFEALRSQLPQGTEANT